MKWLLILAMSLGMLIGTLTIIDDPDPTGRQEPPPVPAQQA
jgi:hypothetical protein